MNHWQRTQLIADLENSTPLIGWLVQRQAAKRLAKDHTGRSTQALVQAALNHPDSSVRKIACRAIEKVGNQAGVDAVCLVWQITRSPWLANLITDKGWIASKPDDLRVLSALQANQIAKLANGKASLIACVVQVANEEKDSTLVRRACNALEQIQKPAGIDAIWAAWFETRLPFLEKVLLGKNTPARKPIEIRLVSILKTGKPEAAYNLSAELVPFMLQLAHDKDGNLSRSARLVLENLTEEDARQALCQQVIDPGDSLAQAIATELRFLPKQNSQKALFLLLTGQWEAYHTLDFDQRLLHLSYQAASGSLRKRILDAIRSSGHTQLLSAIAGKDFRSQVSTLSSSESNTLVQILAEAQAWQKLWDSLPELPYPAALQAIRSISANGWQPIDNNERECFVQLSTLAQVEIETAPEKISSAIPPVVLRAQIHLRKGRLNDLWFAPHQTTLAIAASNRKIILWDLHKGEIQQVIGGFSRSVGRVTYSGDGRLVSAERSREIHHPCRIYLHEDQQSKPLCQLSGPITALEPWQQHAILAAGRDGTLALLDLNQENPLVNAAHLESWPRGLRLSSSDNFALIWGETLSRINLPRLDDAEQLHIPSLDHRIPRQAVFLPQQKNLCLGFSDGSLQVFKLPEGTSITPLPPAHTSAILAIEAMPSSQAWLSASVQGEICFHAWPNTNSARNTVIHPERLTSLRISPDAASMATCDQSSNLLIWDLRPMQIPWLVDQPLGLSTTAQLGALQSLLEYQKLPASIHNALEFLHTLLRFRFRYAVELSQVAEIQAGEFDIDIS